jgi:phage terminase small subunit
MPRRLKPECSRCGKKHPALSEKQRRFVDVYMNTTNPTRAAVEAGYSKKAAKSVAYGLLRNESVQCLIQERASKRAQRMDLRGDDILYGLLRIARFNPKHIFNDNGTMKPLSQIPDEVAEAIAGLKFKDGHLEEIKLPDKVRSFELLGKHKRLFADVQVVEGELTLRERIARGRRRSKEKDDAKARSER